MEGKAKTQKKGLSEMLKLCILWEQYRRTKTINRIATKYNL